MSGRGVMNPERAAKIAAKRIGVTVEHYQSQRASGRRWCYACRTFHPAPFFGSRRICLRAFNSKYAATSSTVYPSGGPGRPPTLDVGVARKLSASGLARSAIARQLGCSYWAVSRALTGPQLGSAYRRARWQTRGAIPPIEHVPDRSADPFDHMVAQEINSLLGGLELEDIERLSEDELEWLRFKLTESGLVGIKVTAEDRERVLPKRAPKHSQRGSLHDALEALGGIDDLDVDSALVEMNVLGARHNLEPMYEQRKRAREAVRLRKRAA